MNMIYARLPQEVKDAMRKVTLKEVLDQRISGKTRIVVKLEEDYYLLPSTKTEISIRNIFDRHLCSSCEMCFHGELCPKVADPSVEALAREGFTIEDAITESKRIEKYDFVTKGVECFNSEKEYLIVSECLRFQKMSTGK